MSNSDTVSQHVATNSSVRGAPRACRGTQQELRLIARRPGRPVPHSWDAVQRRVLEHDRGPLRVLGGPGTGKTALIVEAVAARVARGIALEDLLVLTFSAAAARRLRTDITRRLGQIVAEPVSRTLHSYAFGVLRKAAVQSGAVTPRLLASAERDLVLREILAGRAEAGRDRWPAELAAARGTRAFVEELQDLLMRASEQGLSPRALHKLGRTSGRPEWIEAASVYSEYLNVTALQSPGAFDAPELIQRAIAALEDDPRLLQAERRQRRRIFVDEYSDLDPAQLQLLRLLTSGADEVVVTGDADQSVFSFRGSDPYALADASAVLGSDLQTVVLRNGYRSGPVLSRAANRIADGLPGPAFHRRPTALLGEREPNGAPGNTITSAEVSVAVYESAAIEASQIARRLRRAHLEDGIAWNDMAVLTRSSRNLDILRRQLALAGVPVSHSTAGSLADEPVVGLLCMVLRHLVAPNDITDDEVEALLCSRIGSADPLQVQAFRRRLRLAGQPVGTLSAMLAEPGLPALAGPRLQGAVLAVQRVIRAGRDALEGSAPEVLWAIWSASGLPSQLEQRSVAGGTDGARADRDADAALDLFTEAAELSGRSPGASVAALLAWLEQLEIADRADWRLRRRRSASVELLSAHAAKGREWAVVCVAGVQADVWPGVRARSTLLGSEDLVDLTLGRAFATTDRARQRLTEERRLFYVAVTRARRELMVSAVSNAEQAPSRFLDELEPLPTAVSTRPVLRPERSLDLTGLIGELRAAACDATGPDARRNAAVVELARLADSGVPGADPRTWWGLAELSVQAPAFDPDVALRISPSHLQTYLDCQLRALLEDLAATDGREVVEAAVGSLVHQIAEDAADDADLGELERLADENWPHLEFVAAWQARTERARASAMLAKLARWLQERRDRLTLVAKEQPFTLTVGDVVLSGRIDRLERNHEGGLIVVDLKATKRTFTRAEVEAHTQLAVYQLAVAEGEIEAGGTAAGGLLVHLGKKSKTSPELRQRALAEQDNPSRVADELHRLSLALRQSWVNATPNEGCDQCPVQSSCPTRDDGRQVTEFGVRR